MGSQEVSVLHPAGLAWSRSRPAPLFNTAQREEVIEDGS